MTEPKNVLLIMSDEHRPDALGCAGHSTVRTPTLDGVAEAGTRFTSAYCSSPLCVPSRASFATGQYVHEISYWDNATPYDGAISSWGHHFEKHGIDVTTVGKLDFVPDVDDGFADQRVPAHRETPDVHGLHRDPPIQRENSRSRIEAAGPVPNGEAWYCEREATKTREAIEFLEARADERDDNSATEPWVMSVNYILPHFPLEVERRYYDQYPTAEMDLPIDYPAADEHPILDELRHHFDGRGVDEETLRRTRAAYYGLCTALDDYIAQLLAALDRTGLAEDTLVIYTSDHGEPLGDHELWWKCCMYEPSVGIPLIFRDPGVEEGITFDSPVSLLDLVPTIAECVGIESDDAWQGRSLLPVIRGEREPDPDRAVFSEYHAHGTSRGMFMLRQGRYKYIYYPDNPAQLFDVVADPDECHNLTAVPEHAERCERFERHLREIVDPETIDERARADQREQLAELETED
jgi:choline-sulfatase